MSAATKRRGKGAAAQPAKRDVEARIMLGDLLSYADDVEDSIGEMLDLLSLTEAGVGFDAEAVRESIVRALARLRQTWSWLRIEARDVRNAAYARGAS